MPRDPDHRRAQNREAERRRRDRRKVGRFCPFDGQLLDWETDRLGRVVAVCPTCDRRRSGRCEMCNRPAPPRARFCPACRAHRQRLADRRWTERHPEARKRSRCAWEAKRTARKQTAWRCPGGHDPAQYDLTQRYQRRCPQCVADRVKRRVVESPPPRPVRMALPAPPSRSHRITNREERYLRQLRARALLARFEDETGAAMYEWFIAYETERRAVRNGWDGWKWRRHWEVRS